MKKLLHQGSVKNVFKKDDKIEFEFTNQYSIFDWGIMPDRISKKGENLALITSLLFEKIKKKEMFLALTKPDALCNHVFKDLQTSVIFQELTKSGAKTHFIKYLPPTSILVHPVDIITPQKRGLSFSYTPYQKKLSNTLIPLEVVFRLGVPEGSSLLKRNKSLKPGEMFRNIHIDFYTKLEPQDRLLTKDEAISISGISKSELEELITKTKIYAISLENIFKNIGLTLWDGKFEFAYGEVKNDHREIILVDSMGPDELRLTYKKIPFSKEVLRNIYKKTPWYKNLESDTKTPPRNLTSVELEMVSDIYTSVANGLKDNFFEVPKTIKEYINKKSQTIVIFGQGGREHALAMHLEKSSEVGSVIVIPGNCAMPSDKISITNIPPEKYVSFCKENAVSYTVVGPETLLEEGLSSLLEENSIACASPSKAASILESSKAFSKNLMKKYNIPTAQFQIFKNTQRALEFVRKHESKEFVIKLSCLAAGKGVILCHNLKETQEAILKLAPKNEEIVIEEFLLGREVSYFALCLEDEFKILPTACDYKRLKDQDQGPNTGGMGCYSPASWLTSSDHEAIQKTILTPTLKAMTKEGFPFKGTLFIGIMMTDKGPMTLEYNVRFGDPETQTILPRLESNLNNALYAIATNNKKELQKTQITVSKNSSVHIVKAAKGYPGVHGEVIEKNKVIINESVQTECIHWFFAGVRELDKQLVTSGGRVLGVTAQGKSIKISRDLAYSFLKNIHFEGEQFRTDIGL